MVFFALMLMQLLFLIQRKYNIYCISFTIDLITIIIQYVTYLQAIRRVIISESLSHTGKYLLEKQNSGLDMFMLRPEYIIRTIYIPLIKLNYASFIVTFYEFV